MALQKRIALVGAAKQASKGAPAAAPTFGFGEISGNILNVNADDNIVPVTSVSQFDMAANRDSARAGVSFETLAFPRLSGLLLASLLGSHSTVGAADPWTHTIIPGDNGYYLTLFGRQANEYVKIEDCQIDTLRLEWGTDGKLRISVTIFGITLTLGTASWTATVNEDEIAFLNARGIAGNLGAFTLDGAAAKIASGSIEISQNISGVRLAARVLDDDEVRGKLTGKVSLRLVPDDLATFKRAVTGTTAGTTIAGVPFYGTADFKFVHNATADLQLVMNRLQYGVEFPESDAGGGPVELALAGNILRPSGANAITATLRNAQSAYT